MNKRIKKELYSWIVVILVVLVLRATFVEAVVIPTPSMEETLLIGDALLVNRFIYGIKIPIPFSNMQIPVIPGHAPNRGDMVAFMSPFENRYLVKRCVAIEGDTVEIIDKVLYVNGTMVNETYVYHTDENTYKKVNYHNDRYQKDWEQAKFGDLFGIQVRDNFGPVVVPDDCIFAMGDNRDVSFDSRFWGPLHKKYLKGKPLVIFFSFDPGSPATDLFELLRVWKWRAIRFGRVGKIV
jgi:signal peptidase I